MNESSDAFVRGEFAIDFDKVHRVDVDFKGISESVTRHLKGISDLAVPIAERIRLIEELESFVPSMRDNIDELERWLNEVKSKLK